MRFITIKLVYGIQCNFAYSGAMEFFFGDDPVYCGNYFINFASAFSINILKLKEFNEIS